MYFYTDIYTDIDMDFKFVTSETNLEAGIDIFFPPSLLFCIKTFTDVQYVIPA